jgi:hypothetical protein
VFAVGGDSGPVILLRYWCLLADLIPQARVEIVRGGVRTAVGGDSGPVILLRYSCCSQT